MVRLKNLSLILLFLVQCGCAGYSRVAVEAPPQADRVQAIKKELESVRGLHFKQDVGIEAKKRSAIRRRIETSLVQQYGEGGLENLSLIYARLGLLPGGSDLKKILLNFYGNRALGFYDADGGRLVLRADIGSSFVQSPVRVVSRLNSSSERVLVHELTHVLQAQNFSLDGLDASNNRDRALAFRSVAEGDATLAEFGYRWGGLEEETIALVNKRLLDGVQKAPSSVSSVPRFVLDQFLFQYYSGTTFVSLLLSDKGWAGIDHLYASPPLSTEQVLHPEKYLEHPDPPTQVEIKTLPAIYGPDWQLVENNTVGELMMRCLFERFISPKEAAETARGWGGDRYWAYRRGDALAIVWATVWDSPSDAEEFFQRYSKVVDTLSLSPGLGISRPYVGQQGNTVLVVEGPDREGIDRRVPAIWQGLKLSKETPPERKLASVRERPAQASSFPNR